MDAFYLPLVKRVFPELFANKIVGVQPMASPSGAMFHIRSEGRDFFEDFDKLSELIDENKNKRTRTRPRHKNI